MNDSLEITDTFFSIRAYGPADFAAVTRIDRLSYPTREYGTTHLPDSAAIVVIDRIKFGVVGVLAHFQTTSRRLHIFSLAVHPEFRRFGYGGYLMNHAKIDAAQQHPRAIIQAFTDQRSPDAAHFLKSHGFRGKTHGDDYLKFEFFVR